MKRNIVILQRRLAYLESLSQKNSYVKQEIAALRWIIPLGEARLAKIKEERQLRAVQDEIKVRK